MSATTGEYLKENPNSFYSTPAWAVHRILDAVFERFKGSPDHGNWLEPCAGGGAIIQACQSWGIKARWMAVEIDERHNTALSQVDATRVMGDFFGCTPFGQQVAIFNPPFPLAEKFVRACLPIATHVLCLQRLNWAAKRKALFDEFPPDVYVLPDRPAFGLNKYNKVGTDATEYCWYVWSGDFRGRPGEFRVLDRTPKADLKAHADLIRSVAKK